MSKGIRHAFGQEILQRAPLGIADQYLSCPGGRIVDVAVVGCDVEIAEQNDISVILQFGCELGRVIKDGELKGIVKHPNYRGISATFWRNLKMVGRPEGLQLMGTPFCGKGEPNQCIRVGHASPACLFADVDVFGGA